MKTLFYQSTLFIHIIAGFLALTCGIIAMAVRRKGGTWHNLSGLIFYWSMLGIFVTTLVMFALNPLEIRYQFLMGIGVVSFYPVWSGKRILQMKKQLALRWYDWAAAFGIGLSGIIMVTYGIYGFSRPAGFNGTATLFLVFGMLSLANAYGDLKYYLGYATPEKMHWFFAHAGKMTGGFAAAVTAFCVNVVPRFLPEGVPTAVFLLTWILPGILIGFWGNRVIAPFKRKKEEERLTAKTLNSYSEI